MNGSRKPSAAKAEPVQLDLIISGNWHERILDTEDTEITEGSGLLINWNEHGEQCVVDRFVSFVEARCAS